MHVFDRDLKAPGQFIVRPVAECTVDTSVLVFEILIALAGHTRPATLDRVRLYRLGMTFAARPRANRLTERNTTATSPADYVIKCYLRNAAGGVDCGQLLGPFEVFEQIESATAVRLRFPRADVDVIVLAREFVHLEIHYVVTTRWITVSDKSYEDEWVMISGARTAVTQSIRVCNSHSLIERNRFVAPCDFRLHQILQEQRAIHGQHG